jgi:predicted CopG family antitoxin
MFHGFAGHVAQFTQSFSQLILELEARRRGDQEKRLVAILAFDELSDRAITLISDATL